MHTMIIKNIKKLKQQTQTYLEHAYNEYNNLTTSNKHMHTCTYTSIKQWFIMSIQKILYNEISVTSFQYINDVNHTITSSSM